MKTWTQAENLAADLEDRWLDLQEQIEDLEETWGYDGHQDITKLRLAADNVEMDYLELTGQHLA